MQIYLKRVIAGVVVVLFAGVLTGCASASHRAPATRGSGNSTMFRERVDTKDDLGECGGESAVLEILATLAVWALDGQAD